MSVRPEAEASREVPGPGREAALAARNAFEDTLLSLQQIPLDFDRADVRDRLLRGIQCAYAALDTPWLAAAHLHGLNEAAAIAAEVQAVLARAGDPAKHSALRRAHERLEGARRALLAGADAVAQLQLSRRAELIGGHPSAADPPAPRPFRASLGVPELHAFTRPPLLPYVIVDPQAQPHAAPAPAPAAPRPASLEELSAFAAEAASGALEERFLEEPGAPPAEEPEPPPFLYQPAIEEAEVLRRLARDCLEDIAAHRSLRQPNPMESWLDQASFEQALLENLDAFAAIGAPALPLVSLFHAEANVPDPERAFAVALALGSVEGSDTVGAAVMTLKQSPPEELPGWFDGFWLAPSPAVDAAMADLSTHERPELVALALDVLQARDALTAALIGPLLERPEPAIRLRVARALAATLPREEATLRLEAMLAEAEDDDLFLAAAEALLRHDDGRVLDALRAVCATSPGAAPRSRRQDASLRLLCLAGRPSDLELLLAAARAQPSASLLRGLGRFGHIDALPALLAYLHHDDAVIVGAAAEALERITGAGLREVVEEPWDIEIPPEAAGAAGALPIPLRKVDRVIIDPKQWSAWLEQHARMFDVRLKHRAGAPFTPLQIVAELEAPVTPPEAREEATLELALVTGLRSRFSPHDWVARQRRDLGELRSRVASLRVSPGAWSSGLARESERPAGRSSSRPPTVIQIPEPPQRPASAPPGPAAYPVGVPEGSPFRPPEAIAQTDELDEASRPPSGDPDTITTAIGPTALLAVTQTLPPASSVPASLPFRRTGEGPAPDRGSPEAPGRALEQTTTADPHRDVAETAVAPLIPRSPELPFHSPELEAEDIEPEARTAPVPLVSRGPALPFGPPVAPHRDPPAPAQPGADLSSPPGATTASVLEVPKGPALPFQPPVDGSGPTPPPPPPPHAPTAPALMSVPAHESLEAVLPLAQYAALCAELAAFPEASEAIFQRYGLESQEKRDAVDAAWKERLRGDERQYMAWEEMYRRYHAYWTRRGSRPAG